jgi:hypothetical protein
MCKETKLKMWLQSLLDFKIERQNRTSNKDADGSRSALAAPTARGNVSRRHLHKPLFSSAKQPPLLISAKLFREIAINFLIKLQQYITNGAEKGSFV